MTKSSLRAGAEHVTLTGQVGDRLVYGNSRGHGILEELAEHGIQLSILNKQLAAYGQEITAHRQEITKHKEEIDYLKLRVKRLAQTSDGYLAIRKRFIDVYKRDVKGVAIAGLPAIREGNAIAHEGDAIGDAFMFEREQRTDIKVYRELYGLDYLQVLSFDSKNDDDGGLFRVLSNHATMIASGKPVPDDVNMAFANFVDQIQENWLQLPDKDPNSPLGRAYQIIMMKHNNAKS